MAVNPMQRKARQSFLLGMLVMLVIAAIVVALLFMQIMNMKKSEEATAAASKTVYVLNVDKKSGETITQDDIVSKTLVTSIAKSELVGYDDIPENPEYAEVASAVQTEVQAKIDLGAGTILTQSMIVSSDETVEASLRIQEYNMLTLPSDLDTDDYVDIRLILPNGQDYIVVSKKRVIKSTENTIFVKMAEQEIVMMSNAIVEAYITEGSMLYATKYTDPGIQVASTPTYLASKDVLDLISIDKNITAKALNALYERYNSSPGVRDYINNVVSANMDDAQESVMDGFDAQIKKAQEERSRYIDTLGDVAY